MEVNSPVPVPIKIEAAAQVENGRSATLIFLSNCA
jgi:hypothetical protein